MVLRFSVDRVDRVDQQKRLYTMGQGFLNNLNVAPIGLDVTEFKISSPSPKNEIIVVADPGVVLKSSS